MPFRETTDADRACKTLGFGIDIIASCNLNRVTCCYLDSPANRPASPGSELSLERFEQAIGEAAAAGFREVYVLGGEPTLHPRLLDMLACAAHAFEQVLLVTNGLRLSDRRFCRSVAATGCSVAVQRHAIGTGQGESRLQDELVGFKGTLPLVNRAFAHIEELFELGQPFPLGSIFATPRMPLPDILASPMRAFFTSPLSRACMGTAGTAPTWLTVRADAGATPSS